VFWGSFDLAVTRFLGAQRAGPSGGVPSLPDAVTREAYSHEVISAGFWPGGNGFDEAAVLCLRLSHAGGAVGPAVAPEPAFWHRDLREFLLPYADVQAAPIPTRSCSASSTRRSMRARRCSTGRPGW
jgi:hypothetical protein